MFKKLFSPIFALFFTVITGLIFLPKVVLSPPPTPAVHLSNPYLINQMQARTYQSLITIGHQVKKTSTSTSYKVSFTSDELKEYALMIVPNSSLPPEGFPVVIVNHGHIVPKDYSTENSYINTSNYFANSGFLVLKPDFRGHDNSQGEADALTSRITYAVDVLNLLAGIKSLPQANSEKIFMYGHSMGGDVTLRVLEVCGTCVQAATLWAPAVTSWPDSFLYFVHGKNSNPDRYASMLLQLHQQFTPDQYTQVSTLDNLSLVKVPVNLHQGTADQSVPFTWGEKLAGKLKAVGVNYHFYVYENDNHDISNHWSEALARDVELFNQYK